MHLGSQMKAANSHTTGTRRKLRPTTTSCVMSGRVAVVYRSDLHRWDGMSSSPAVVHNLDGCLLFRDSMCWRCMGWCFSMPLSASLASSSSAGSRATAALASWLVDTVTVCGRRDDQFKWAVQSPFKTRIKSMTIPSEMERRAYDEGRDYLLGVDLHASWLENGFWGIKVVFSRCRIGGWMWTPSSHCDE